MNLREIREIGCGAYGAIFLVEEVQTGRQFALKKTRVDVCLEESQGSGFYYYSRGEDP